MEGTLTKRQNLGLLYVKCELRQRINYMSVIDLLGDIRTMMIDFLWLKFKTIIFKKNINIIIYFKI